jgi:hypothetical protein
MHMTSKERRLAAVAERARRCAEADAPAKSPPERSAPDTEPLAETADDASDAFMLDRRRAVRAAVASSLAVRPIGGFNYQARLDDVSAAGCRVELVEEAELGEPLIARFPQLEPLVGEVRWKEGPMAGLEFTRAMHPAVLDALVTRLRHKDCG